VDAQHGKGQTAQQSLHQCDDHRALDGGAHHGGELVQQIVGVLAAHRDGAAHHARQRAAIAQKEEQQVQHDAQIDDQEQRVLSDRQRVR